MYQVGGSLRFAMVLRLWSFPAGTAATTTKMAPRTWPPKKPSAPKKSHIQAEPREIGAAPASN
jgi:hypothetical protein